MILFVVIYSPRTSITFHQNDNHNDYHICVEQRARRPAGISVWRAVISVILYFHSSGVRLSGQVKETSRGHFYSAYSSFSHHHLFMFVLESHIFCHCYRICCLQSMGKSSMGKISFHVAHYILLYKKKLIKYQPF